MVLGEYRLDTHEAEKIDSKVFTIKCLRILYTLKEGGGKFTRQDMDGSSMLIQQMQMIKCKDS